jgi:uncharacterized protein YbaA (DUF1428 family)
MDAQKNNSLNRQAKFEGSLTWTDYGNVGLIEAAALHIQATAKTSAAVQVRDESEPDAIFSFNMHQKQREFFCDNPRQGSE